MASTRCKCQLDNGLVLTYHAAAALDGGQAYDPQIFSYMGTGVIYSIGGQRMTGSTRLRFYALRDGRPRWAR